MDRANHLDRPAGDLVGGPRRDFRPLLPYRAVRQRGGGGRAGQRQPLRPCDLGLDRESRPRTSRRRRKSRSASPGSTPGSCATSERRSAAPSIPASAAKAAFIPWNSTPSCATSASQPEGAPPMIVLNDLRYVRLGTRISTPPCATRPTSSGCSWRVARARALYLRADDRDHTLVYTKAIPVRHVAGFEVRTAAELEAAAAELDSAGRDVRCGTRARMRAARVDAFIAFEDPSGNSIELVVGRHTAADGTSRRATPASRVSPTSACTRSSPSRDEEFWTTDLQCAGSDWIGDAPLLRIDPVHHRIALFPSTAPRRAAHQPPGREHRRHHALVLFPAEKNVRSASVPAATRPRARCSSISKDPTA